MGKKDFFPIILGSDENAYGDARLIYEAYGIKPILMCSKHLLPCYYSNLFTLVENKDFDKTDIFVDKLLDQIKKLSKDYEKIIVVPCSDYYTELLVSNCDKFEGLIANKFISNSLLQDLYCKDKFYEMCEKHGLDYPSTYVATPDKRIEAIDKIEFDFPIVVKPENSNAYEYLHAEFEGKKKVYFFNSKDEYLKTITEMNKSNYKGKLIIQEYVPGGDDVGRVVNSYSNNEACVKATSLGQPIIEEYEPHMLGNYASIITRYDKELYLKVQKFLKAIGYVGFSNIDMKYDARTGRYLAFELNPRLGRSSFYVYGSGINMMKVLIDDVVYGKEKDCEFGNKTHLWMNIPKKTIKKFVQNKELKKEALYLIKNKKSIKTLPYKKDRNAKRSVYVKYFYKLQHDRFKKYFFVKDELGQKK